MTSLLSFIGTSINATYFYSTLCNSTEFLNFMKILTDNSSPDIIKQSCKNYICLIFDPIVDEILMNNENNLIFTNTALSKDIQSKLFMGKILTQICDNNPDLFNTIDDKEVLIRYFVTLLNEIKDLDKITNGKDVYTLLVDHYATIITNFIQNILPTIFCKMDETNIIEIINKCLQYFHKIYNYSSQNINDQLLELIKNNEYQDNGNQSSSSESSDGNDIELSNNEFTDNNDKNNIVNNKRKPDNDIISNPIKKQKK